MKAIRNHSGRIEVRPGLKAIAAAQYAYRRAFESALKHDGIASDAKFVVFSNQNPFVQFIDNARKEVLARIAEYRAGGYVGLQFAQPKPKESK